MEPESYVCGTKKLCRSSKWCSWNKAMQIELSMIEKNHTWELVSRHSDKHVIGVEWVFKTKLNLWWTSSNEQGLIGGKRLCTETMYWLQRNLFALVARLDTVRTLFALGAQKNWKIFSWMFGGNFTPHTHRKHKSSRGRFGGIGL